MPFFKPNSRWRIYAVALAVWLLFATAWSVVVIRSAYTQYVHQTLRERAGSIRHRWDRLVADKGRELLADEIAYRMIWSEEGRVLYHTAPHLDDTYLDVKQWPILEPGQEERFQDLTSAPLETGHGRHPLPVSEITVEVERPAAMTGSAAGPASQRVFLSIAYRRDYLLRSFAPSIYASSIASLAFTGAGSVLLILTLYLTFRRLDQSRREIEQTARARTSLLTERGMLASVLAHEVRSPLTALRFNLHALRALLAGVEGPPSQPDKRLELTDRCEREIRRLDGMLNDFLQRTQVVTPAEPADLNGVINEAVEFLSPAMERNHIRISRHLDPADPRVRLHPDELRQVILNLAANAMEAMPAPRGGTLAISTVAPGPAATGSLPAASDEASAALPRSAAPPTEGMITLLFRDSGVGIPTDRLERIFEPFFSTKPNGSGLGLTLVRRVVSGAGGTVFVESKPGDGTTFRILLPPA
jgi:signal transduction histidine kinase